MLKIEIKKVNSLQCRGIILIFAANIVILLQKSVAMKRILTIVIVLLACLAGNAQIDGLVSVETTPILVDENEKQIGKLLMRADEKMETSTKFSKVDDNTSLMEYTFTAKEDVTNPRILVAFAHAEKPLWWMIPATKYNSTDRNVSLQKRGDIPSQQFGVYSWQRTSIQGLTYTEGKTYAVATWSDGDCAATLLSTKENALHCLMWPEIDNPVGNGYELKKDEKELPTASRSWEVGDYNFAPKNDVTMKKGEKKVIRMYIYTSSVKPNHAAMSDFLRSAWSLAKVPSLPEVNDKKLWKEGVGKIKDQSWSGVESLAVANVLLADYAQKGGKALLSKGMELLNRALDLEWKSLTGRQQAELAVGLLRADALAIKSGKPQPKFRERALEICQYILAEQYPDGIWDKTGHYYLPALLSAYETTKDNAYLQAAQKGYAPYMAALRESDGGWWWGDVDRDSAVPLLQAALRLYKHTGTDTFLQDAVLASSFLSTWLWHSDVDWPVKDGQPGKQYHTFGLSRPSSDCPQFDIEACRWVPEWMELAKLTGDRQWQEKARIIWKSSALIASQTSEVRPMAVQLNVLQRIKEGVSNSYLF